MRTARGRKTQAEGRVVRRLLKSKSVGIHPATHTAWIFPNTSRQGQGATGLLQGVAMSTYTDWIRWDARCQYRPGFGVTAGDTMHRGLGDYSSLTPMPNGLPIDTRAPGETEWGRARAARARRDIDGCRWSAATTELAEQLTDIQIHEALKRIIQWEQTNSQKQTQPLMGF